MDLIKDFILKTSSEDVQYNLIIRGVGGTNINSKSDLALYFTFLETDVTNFAIQGNDVYARVVGNTNYGMSNAAFYQNANIINIEETDGYLTYTRYQALSECPNLTGFKASGSILIREETFKNSPNVNPNNIVIPGYYITNSSTRNSFEGIANTGTLDFSNLSFVRPTLTTAEYQEMFKGLSNVIVDMSNLDTISFENIPVGQREVFEGFNGTLDMRNLRVMNQSPASDNGLLGESATTMKLVVDSTFMYNNNGAPHAEITELIQRGGSVQVEQDLLNLFIGQGESKINQPTALESVININAANDVKSFNIDFGDVEVVIKKEYQLLSNAFYQDTNINEFYDGADLCTGLSTSCFQGCTSLEQVRLGGITEAKNSAFNSCSSLEAGLIIMPNLQLDKGNSAFMFSNIMNDSGTLSLPGVTVIQGMSSTYAMFNNNIDNTISMPNLVSADMPNTFLSFKGIADLPNLTSIGDPAVVNNFFGSPSSTTMTLKLNKALATNNAGGEDADVAAIRAKGATIIYYP